MNWKKTGLLVMLKKIQNSLTQYNWDALRIGLLVVGLYRLIGIRFGQPVSDFSNIRYFNSSEFDSPDLLGSGLKMVKNVVELVDNIRHEMRQPMIINSGFRTEEHNKKLIQLYGASSNSSHKYGLAVDIHCSDLEYMRQLIYALRKRGVKRIGQYISERGNLFVHADLDTKKTYQGEWCKIRGQKIIDKKAWLVP
jgi:hypothetical protein